MVNTLNAYEKEELKNLICKVVDYYVGLDEEVREEVKNMDGKGEKDFLKAVPKR